MELERNANGRMKRKKDDSHAQKGKMSNTLTSKGALIAYLDFDLASFSSLVADCTVSPSLNEVPRSSTTRELEVGAYRAIIRPSQFNAGARLRCPTKIIGFPLGEAYVKLTRTM